MEHTIYQQFLIDIVKHHITFLEDAVMEFVNACRSDVHTDIELKRLDELYDAYKLISKILDNRLIELHTAGISKNYIDDILTKKFYQMLKEYTK